MARSTERGGSGSGSLTPGRKVGHLGAPQNPVSLGETCHPRPRPRLGLSERRPGDRHRGRACLRAAVCVAGWDGSAPGVAARASPAAASPRQGAARRQRPHAAEHGQRRLTSGRGAWPGRPAERSGNCHCLPFEGARARCAPVAPTLCHTSTRSARPLEHGQQHPPPPEETRKGCPAQLMNTRQWGATASVTHISLKTGPGMRQLSSDFQELLLWALRFCPCLDEQSRAETPGGTNLGPLLGGVCCPWAS